ncbi:MAG: hypothetical protein R3B57_06895 [Phycisphaerales bacterium]
MYATDPILSLHVLDTAINTQATSILRLSTGLQINRAADNPSGMIVAANIRAVLSVLDAQSRGYERADAYASTADSALGEASSMLADAHALTISAANTGALSDDELDAMQLELDTIVQGVDRIGQTTEFASTPVFDGDAVISTGDDSIRLDELSSTTLGVIEIDGEIYSLADVASGGSADLNANPELAQQIIAAAQDDLATRRGELGAFQSHAIAPGLHATSDALRDLGGALSIIADTNYASETASLTRASVLSAGSIASLALASAISRGLLPLLAP